MIFDVCSLLFGIPPESFYAKIDGKSSRVTRYYKTRKGVFGHTIAYIGVVEDHAKGTLHYHILIWAGLTPYALQRFVHITAISEAIKKVINAMYQSELPYEAHVHGIVRKILTERTDLAAGARDNMDAGARAAIVATAEPLFERTDPLSVSDAQSGAIPAGERSRGITNSVLCRIRRCVQAQVSQQQMHSHMKTCRKGFWGKTGCRLCMPAGLCPCTRCVLLVPYDDVDDGSTVDNGSGIDIGDIDIGMGWHEEEYAMEDDDDFFYEPGYVAGDDDEDEDEDEVVSHGSAVFDLEDNTEGPPISLGAGDNYQRVEEVRCSDGPQTYTLKHAYEKRYDDSMYVWETGRPEIIGKLNQPEKSDDGKTLMNRAQIVESLHLALDGFPEYSPGSKFWNWIGALDDLNLILFYDRLLQDLGTANGNVSVFNPVLSYCTGGHNNCQMLGGMVQAKGA